MKLTLPEPYTVAEVASVAYETMCLIDSLYRDGGAPTWDELERKDQQGYIRAVQFILDNPAASERQWYEKFSDGFGWPVQPDRVRLLQVRLWRNVVHAFVG